MATSTFTVALVGNPNTGKSTLFNALTGLRQHVGNYPGVTVEKKTGSTRHENHELHLIDLPGTYSLAPRSPDEMVSVDVLLGHLPGEDRPDVIVSIVDATNLERHLYLTTQLMDLGKPMVLAVNLMDRAQALGIEIDCARLAEQLGIPVIPLQANRGIGLEELKGQVVRQAKIGQPATPVPFPPPFEAEVQKLSETLGPGVERFLVSRVLLDVGGHAEKQVSNRFGPRILPDILQARERLAAAGCSVPKVEARTRFAWIRKAVADCVKRPASRPVTWSDRLDRVFTHKVWGTLIFLVLMFGVFESIFVGAKPLMDGITTVKDWFGDQVRGTLPAGPLRSLIVDGAINGVGSVLVFLPQIMILFAVIAVLEDCGYMARAAFLMDKLMSKCGLNGKSFIPLLSSIACAIPGIMATRVIENRRDRLATILVAPLMSCSARLPLYSLLIGVFLRDPWWLPGLALFGLYMIGLVTAPLVAFLLKRTLLRGETPIFVMEMPAFKVPQVRAVLRRMIGAGWAFVYRAGTIILASMILVWAVLYFPVTMPDGRSYDVALEEVREQVEELPEEDKEGREIKEQEANTLHGEWKRQSYLGRLGRSLEPGFEPLGWDWKIGMAAIASFPAREVVVGTLGIVYDQGEAEVEADEDVAESPLGKKIREEWSADSRNGRYRIPTALSLLVFFALCCQCASTLAVIRRETLSWAWPAFTFVYMTTLAYLGALVTFQVGKIVVGAG